MVAVTADDDETAPRMKGAAMRSFVAWFEREVEPGVLKRVIDDLPPPHGSVFDSSREDFGMLPSRWYRADTIHAVLEGLLRGRSRDEQLALAQRGGDIVVEDMQRGVYKVLFDWFLTPGRYAKIVDRAWKLNYDNGHVVTTVLAPHRHKGVVQQWDGHHPFLCMFNVAIKRAIYQAMGCRGAAIESSYCIDAGQSECGSIITWVADEVPET